MAFCKLVIEFFYFVVIIDLRWGVHWYYCHIGRDCPQTDSNEPAGTGRHPMTVFTMSLRTRNSTPCSCLSSFALKKTLCPSSVVVLPKFSHLISRSKKHVPSTYLSILCVSSWSFLATDSVLASHVSTVMLSLQRIFDDAPVAYLTPPSGCTVFVAVLVDPGGDRSRMVWLLVFIIW